MTTTVSLPGIGQLSLEHGPGGLAVWSLRQPVASAMYRDPIGVNILLDGVEDLDSADLPMITRVLGDIDHYLMAGLHFAHATLLADPAWFGLAENERAPYRECHAEELPLHDPRLNFYADSEWLLHFQEGRFPVCDPYGLVVVFDQLRPVRLEDLSNAESID